MSRELLERFGKLAGKDYTRDEIIGAAANLLLNALRQKHERLAAAEDELEGLARDMKRELKRIHYGRDGTRRGLVILGESVMQHLRSEGIELFGRKQ